MELIFLEFEHYDRLVRATSTIDNKKLKDMIYQNFIVEIKNLLYSCYFGPVKHRVQDLKNISEYLKDLYQIPAFAHHTDFAAIIRQGKTEGAEDGFCASTHYDLALPNIDWDAQWKVSTERAYLSSDPTHPIYLGDNRRFDLDPTWYDLGAESLKKLEKKIQSSCGCCG